MSIQSIEVRLLTAMESATLERVDPDVFDNPIRLELAAQYLADPGNLLVVAIHAGVVIGMGSAIAYVHPDKPRALFINEVGVAERYQRQGVGKRLMQVLLEQGRLMGCTEAWVATEEDNAAARALYTSVAGEEDPARAVVYTWPLLEPSGVHVSTQ
jgi:ribosomal protein S18 acetylase RimI-like enzyme